MKVLIVDDKRENLYLLRALLSARGDEVLEASDGQQALELARQVPPQLIISDILMPVMDGFALCRAWRADAQLKSIPFVFYTATYTEPKDEEFALSLGADLFLIKPLEGPVFLREIANMLKRKSADHPAEEVASREPNDSDFYRQYSVRLVRKLESKLEEIEQKNRQLVGKEMALREVNAKLGQRVAERTAELTRLNQELISFNYSVSHDLRAPLRHISGFAQALAEDCDDQLSPTGLDYLARIRSATDNMGEMIEALLRLSRLTYGEIHYEEVDLSLLANRIVANLREESPERSVEVFVKPGMLAAGDRNLLEIVLENLLDNAWKYTSKTPQPSIEVGVSHQGAESVYFVTDNGAGFDMQYADKLFGPFQRLHGKEFDGSGIGLATVRRIVARHGGRVWAEGTPGGGAGVYFTLGARVCSVAV